MNNFKQYKLLKSKVGTLLMKNFSNQVEKFKVGMCQPLSNKIVLLCIHKNKLDVYATKTTAKVIFYYNLIRFFLFLSIRPGK